MEGLENKFYKYLGIFDILLGIVVTFGNLNLEVKGILLIILICVFVVLVLIFERERKYIKFVEFLFDNGIHNFNLLPRQRMFLHQHKICNKVNIEKLEITYLIDGKRYQETNDDLCGDVVITYDYTIKEIKGNEYKFITGNDYSKKVPRIKISYGNQNAMTEVVPHRRNCPVYLNNVIRDLSWEFDQRFLPQKGSWEMKIVLEYEKAFDFQRMPMDTIICLPQIFGGKVGELHYHIKIFNMNKNMDFHCNLYKITNSKSKYVRTNQPVTIQKNSDEGELHTEIEANIHLENLKKEQAYYFRLGTAETDEETMA